MRVWWWDKIGLTVRTAILIIIPLVMMILALIYYVTTNEISSAERNANQRGELLAKHLSSISELAVVARDLPALASITKDLLTERGIVSASIEDSAGVVLVENRTDKTITKRQRLNDYTAPIYLTRVTVGGIENELRERSEKESSLVGRVRISVLNEKSASRPEAILVVAFFSALVGVLVSTFIGYKLSQSITEPVLRLNRTVSSLTKGNLTARIDGYSDGELGALEHGINMMAESIDASHSNLMYKIQAATKSLNETVDELEDKNQELEKSRQEAVSLGEEKVQLLARMSHELRTPLNSVIGFSRLLKKEKRDRVRSEYTQTIISSATHLSSVIDDVMLFTKLEFDSMPLNITVFSPREVCEDTVVMLSPAAYEKGLELILIVNKAVPDLIEGDVPRIKQVLTNLINNAIKFTDKGEVVLSVELFGKPQGESATDYLKISVQDTGYGIKEDKIGVLFEEFSQIEDLRTRKAEGIGLGLFISRELAKVMGGNITVESIEGEGSKFTFSLPMLNPSKDKRFFSSHRKLEDKNALLLEPRLSAQQSLLSLLEWFGLNVSIIESVQEINQYLDISDRKIDLLVLSFSEAAEYSSCVAYLDGLKSKHEIPVQIIYGVSELRLDESEACERKYSCLSKPVKSTSLYKSILELLSIEPEIEENQDECETKACLEGKQVLVVEDNKFNQELLSTMLKERMADVELVDGGKKALFSCEKNKYDLIFMDLHMPDMDGLSVSAEIRNDGRKNVQTPIALVTADVFFDRKAAVEKSVVDFILNKPIYERELDKLIMEVFGGDDSVAEKKNLANQSTDRADSIIPTEELRKEILRLCEETVNQVKNDNQKSAQEILHQLVGVSGYYQLEKVTREVKQLQDLVRRNKMDEALLQVIKVEKMMMH